MLSYFAQAFGITERDLMQFVGGHEWSDGTVYTYDKDGKTFPLDTLSGLENVVNLYKYGQKEYP